MFFMDFCINTAKIYKIFLQKVLQIISKLVFYNHGMSLVTSFCYNI